jgi:hypothetical protein
VERRRTNQRGGRARDHNTRLKRVPSLVARDGGHFDETPKGLLVCQIIKAATA